MIKDFFRIVNKNIKNRKLRSWLTIIGIIVSVASIVALISISDGLENAIEEQFSKIGSNRSSCAILQGTWVCNKPRGKSRDQLHYSLEYLLVKT